MDIAIKQGQLRIYGAGGAGTNIAARFNAVKSEPGSATFHPVFIDTSRSNLIAAKIDTDENLFLLKDTDGSGKVRRDNHEAIAKNIRQIIQQFPPLDFNVVVFATAGGSGSVFGPLLVSELLATGQQVIAVVIGSNESAVSANNTINTLKSMENIAAKTDTPVVMHYSHNGAGFKRSDVDQRALAMITALGYLVSGQNSELDSRDIRNWINFKNATSVGACLAHVELAWDDVQSDAPAPIAVASLYVNPDKQELGMVPEYHTAGFPLTPIEGLKSCNGLHFVIGIDQISVIYKDARDTVAEIDASCKARVMADSLVTSKDKVSDSGLVL
jgi:hypothetical protein